MKQNKEAEIKYNGRQYIKNAKSVDKDILSAVLDPKKLYTEKEVRSKYTAYLKREVK